MVKTIINKGKPKEVFTSIFFEKKGKPKALLPKN